MLDCVVIGGGAAGLCAATYLARFRRRILVLDGGSSRLLSIPTSHNYPGFANGIHGNDLLARLRDQAVHYGAEISTATVERLERQTDGSFLVHAGRQQWQASTVILATGVVDVAPAFADVKRAVADGSLRYCPICDGYESIGKKVAVLGRGKSGLGEALFVRHYADEVTLLCMEETIRLDEEDRQRLAQAQVEAIAAPIRGVVYDENAMMQVLLADGSRRRFDVVYAALGTLVNSGLAQVLGAECTDNGELLVDAHQQTSVDGLYAAGDLVAGLNQITVAMGHAAIAATAIHNRLGYRGQNA